MRGLADQPAMRAVVADLQLDTEAQVALAFRLALAFDRAATDPVEAAYARLMTPAIKFLVCKAAPAFTYEALERFGGNGYTEDLPLARYDREAPLNAIWEESGNVIALDVLRAAGRHPDAALGVVERIAATVSAVHECGPVVRTILRVLQSGESERRAVSCARTWPVSPPWRPWWRRVRPSPPITPPRGLRAGTSSSAGPICRAPRPTGSPSARSRRDHP